MAIPPAPLPTPRHSTSQAAPIRRRPEATLAGAVPVEVLPSQAPGADRPSPSKGAFGPPAGRGRTPLLTDKAGPLSASERNRLWLEAFAACRDGHQRRVLRQALVRANLPLVRSIAARYGVNSALAFDDLTQVGSLGLLKAIDTFDPRRSGSLSSIAVPYVKGAIQHEMRDREPLVRVPRRLWELRQRALALQEQRRQQGKTPLLPAKLCQALDCPLDVLDEALALGPLGRPRSLDEPMAAREGKGADGRSLLDALVAPPQAEPRADDDEDSPESPQLAWLRAQLATLDPPIRDLLVGRLQLGCTWVELGQRLGWHPRMAQRRFDAALAGLRDAAQQWADAQSASNPAASTPATSAPGVSTQSASTRAG
jgi:RNA polymerase sigma-B factor